MNNIFNINMLLILSMFYLIAAIFTLILESKFNFKYLYYFIPTISIAWASLLIFESFGGLIIAVSPAIIIYKTYHKKMYSSYIFYFSYMSFYLSDLYGGYIITNILKKDFNSFFMNNQLMYYFIMLIAALIFTYINKIVTKFIKIKEIIMPRKIENVLSVLLFLVGIGQMIATIYVKQNNISANAVKNSLFYHHLVIIIIIYIVFYVLQKCYKDYIKVDSEFKELTEKINSFSENKKEKAKRVAKNVINNHDKKNIVKIVNKNK